MEFITREILSTNWLTILIMVCLSLLVVAKRINALRFNEFIMLFSTNKYILSNQKANRLSTIFNSILLLLQIVSVSLFLYLGVEVFEWEVQSFELNLFFKIAIVYTFIVICKLLIEKIVATIFSIDTVIDEYLFYKVSYRNFMGLILLPINIVFIYTFQASQIAFLIIFVLFVILNMIVMISFYKKNENIILNHLFYFILYLCALEIAPYFILYKLVS